MNATFHTGLNMIANFSNKSKLLAEYLIIKDIQFFSELINILIL